MISLEYDEFDEEDINDIIEIYKDLQKDPNNDVQNNQKNIEYFNTNIMPFCKDRGNASKILDKITNKGLKEQFKKIVNITDITNNYDSNIGVINSQEEGNIHIPNNTCVKDNINNFQINTNKAEIEHQNVVDNDIDNLNGNASIEPIIKKQNEINTKKAEIEHQNMVDNNIDYLNGNASIEPRIKKENESSNIGVINSKEEGDIHTPNNTKDNISNFQINTKKAEIEHQNGVDNDIDDLNGNASIEPIIKEENESFNTPKEKSKNVQYNYNHNLKNNNIPPNNIKVTRSQITAIIRNINDPIKQEELLQMFTGTPIQNRKLFIKKILSICSIIGDIKKHIEILESILKIKINKKVHNVKTKVQSPVNNTNNFQPFPQETKQEIVNNNAQPTLDDSDYLQEIKSILNDNEQIDINKYNERMKSFIANNTTHQIPFELYYKLYVIHLLCTYKSKISYIQKFDQLYCKLAKIDRDYWDYFSQFKQSQWKEDNSSLNNRIQILSLIENRIKNKKPISFDTNLFSLMVNVLDKGSMEFDLQTIKLYLYSIEFYKEYRNNKEILNSIQAQLKKNNYLLEVYYYYSFISLSQYKESFPSSPDSNSVLLDMFLYDWMYNDNHLFPTYNKDAIKALSNNNDINVQLCLSICNQWVDQKQQYPLQIAEYLHNESIIVKAGVILLSIINKNKGNTIQVKNLINTIKQYYQKNKFVQLWNDLTIDVHNYSPLANCHDYSFIHSNIINDKEINLVINDKNIQFIFIIPKEKNNEGLIYERTQNKMWWCDYTVNKEINGCTVKKNIKESITKYKEKIDIYIIYKVFQFQKFFEQYKNRLNEIKDIWYSIMIKLLFRYPIQCINYKKQIIQYLQGCINLPNAKDYIVENLKTLRDDLPSFYNSFSESIQHFQIYN